MQTFKMLMAAFLVTFVGSSMAMNFESDENDNSCVAQTVRRFEEERKLEQNERAELKQLEKLYSNWRNWENLSWEEYQESSDRLLLLRNRYGHILPSKL